MLQIYTFLLVFSLSLIIGPCEAQTQSTPKTLVFNHLTTADGLPGDETNCVYQDKRGFIWIGTSNGLSCYSGNRILVFTRNPKDAVSLPDNDVLSLAEDNSNHLWIATNRGLSRMDLTRRKIEKVYKQFKNMNREASLLFDTNQKLWLGSFGLHLYDSTCDCFHEYLNTNYTNEADYKKSNTITCLLRDSKNRMWVGTRLGIYQFNPTSGVFSKVFNLLPSKQTEKNNSFGIISAIYEDHNQQLWLGTWGLGLVKFFPEEKRYVAYPVVAEKSSKHTYFNLVRSICEAPDSKNQYHLWVSTDQGFGFFSETEKTFLYSHHDPLDDRSIAVSEAQQLYCDNSGMLWIATQSNGINILDPYRQLFSSLRYSTTSIAPAETFGDINFVYGHKGFIWVATWYGNALYKLDRNFNIIKKWERVPPLSPSQENNRCNHVFIDQSGLVWISTLNGLHVLDEQTGTFKSYTHNPQDKNSIPSDKVVKYFEDSEGIGWVCFYKGGICKFDIHTEKFYDYVQGVKKGNGFTDYFNVWDILEDHNHNVWFADDGLGLWKYDRNKGTLKRMFQKEFSEGHVTNVFEDTRNTLWISTGNGLVKIHGDSLQLLTTSDGLPTNSIQGAIADKSNRLWILTSQGLAVYESGRGIFKVFTEKDGLGKIYTDGAAFQKLEDGRVVIGSGATLTAFDPEMMAINQIIPPVQIVAINVSGKPIHWIKNNQEKEITLTYDQNQFSADFDVLNYSDPSANKFYYQLAGMDKDWVATNHGHANYTNLDAGTYLFRVKGINGDGISNNKGDSIRIVVTPPFWRTWWFILLEVAIVSLLVYLFFKIRLRQALKMELLRMKISTDLHDDIGSTLSSISILSDIILRETDPNYSRSMISQIKSNSITLMDKMDDIVWSINPKHDTIGGFLQRLKHFASTLFEAKGINYEFETSPEVDKIKLPMEFRQHLYLIVKEAINNSIKYSACTFTRIRVTYPKPFLMVEVMDNGKGFLPALEREGNGIESMKHRAQLMKAALLVNAAPGKGTTISLKLKIK